MIRSMVLFAISFLLMAVNVSAQQLSKAANDAFIITRMIEKFHFQPKPVNDTFSLNVYHQFIQQLDEDKLFFTTEDIKLLSNYQYKLDEEILEKKSAFLELASGIYEKRLRQADTLINEISKTPFNFSIAEKLSVSEDTSYPANNAAMKKKWNKLIKADVLNDIIDEIDFDSLSTAQQKKEVDSTEPMLRARVQKSYSRQIKLALNSPGGVPKTVGDEYCKAIAECYDPHTEFMPLTDKENFEKEIGQKPMGFGFSLDEDEDGGVIIDDLKPGGPAFKSGQISKGDKIESIQWEGKEAIDVSEASIREIGQIFSVSNHDKAVLKVKKADGSIREINLYKAALEEDEVEEDKVKSYILKGAKSVGYISLPAFYEDWEDDNGVNGCANDVAKEILKLKKENIDGLILDLRYNGGGSVQEAIELAGIFIDVGPVGQYKSREAKLITLKDMNRGTIYDGPLMIMVNGYSASASELIAAALQDYNRAVIIGTPTYGKATAQAVLPMDTTIQLDEAGRDKKAENYIKLTRSQLYRISGKTAQLNGVQPDVILPDALQVNGKKESNNAFAIPASSIEANKYYKAFQPLPISTLSSAANKAIEESAYFKSLKNYTASLLAAKQKKDIPLQLSEAIKEEKEVSQKNFPTDTKTTVPAFTVINHAFDNEKLNVNSDQKIMQEQWRKTINKDPYISISYDLMLLMIK